MALYNVIRPGIVGGKHYTKRSRTPVEVGDAEAKKLVADGILEPVVLDNFVPGPVLVGDGKSADEAPLPEDKPRRGRRDED
ncbi:MAG: hypothetical protein VYA67_21950 [Actinomycetota bacterium]|nr:hypothetical protein [Actinomycetota bacterium]